MSYRIRTTAISPTVSIAAQACDDLDEAWLVYLTACGARHAGLVRSAGAGSPFRLHRPQILAAPRAGILPVARIGA